MEALVVGNGDIFPRSDLILDFFIAPPAVDDLVVEAKASIEVAVLAVAVCALVEVHVVEVDRVIRNLVEVLRRKVQQRLLQELRAANPVLCRGERVHPGDDACDIVVVIDVLHELRDAVCRRHDALELDRVRELAALIELLDDVFRIAGDITELLLTIEELRTSDKPEFVIVREFQHDVTSLLLLCFLLRCAAGGFPYLCVTPLFDLALFWP